MIPNLGYGSRLQILLLFASSLVFYAFDKPWLVLLLLFSILLNCIISKKIILSSALENKRQKFLLIGIISNLLLIAFFKYAYLIVDMLAPDGSLLEIKQQLANIPLPIGISFYTFQAITLIVDLHRKGVIGVKHLHDLFNAGKDKEGLANIGFYIAFFPQLVAGPIVKAHDFIQQIKTKTFLQINWSVACNNIIAGYFFKMVVADNLKGVTYLLNSASMSRLGKLDLIVLLYGHSFQIFADFAGYSLIAIGLGALFGYRFPVNFNFPYISSSITEFWRRWHISLSSFLKEYLYIPLGGNRKGKARTYTNLFILPGANMLTLDDAYDSKTYSFSKWLPVFSKEYRPSSIVYSGLKKFKDRRGESGSVDAFINYIPVIEYPGKQDHQAQDGDEVYQLWSKAIGKLYSRNYSIVFAMIPDGDKSRVREYQLAKTLAAQYGLPFVDLKSTTIELPVSYTDGTHLNHFSATLVARLLNLSLMEIGGKN